MLNERLTKIDVCYLEKGSPKDTWRYERFSPEDRNLANEFLSSKRISGLAVVLLEKFESNTGNWVDVEWRSGDRIVTCASYRVK